METQNGDVLRIIFTGLDGALLEAGTESWEPAAPAVHAVQRQNIPLVFCSSKTRAEQLAIQQMLGIQHPFIVENGSGVYFRPGYFRDPVPGARQAGSTYGSGTELDVVELGIPIVRVRELLDDVRNEAGLRFQRFSDLSIDAIAEKAGLDMDAAARAAEREFSDTIEESLTDEEWDDFILALAERGLTCVEGERFTSVFSALTDKGRSVRLVTELLRREADPIVTIGIGDGSGDADLLAAVDRPFLVQKPDETWDPLEIDGLQRVHGIGPAGWRRVIEEVIPSDSS